MLTDTNTGRVVTPCSTVQLPASTSVVPPLSAKTKSSGLTTGGPLPWSCQFESHSSPCCQYCETQGRCLAAKLEPSPWLCGSDTEVGDGTFGDLALYGWDILRTGYELSSALSSEASSECSENLNHTLPSEVSSDCSDDLHLDLDSVIQEGLFGSIISIINSSDTVDEGDSSTFVTQTGQSKQQSHDTSPDKSHDRSYDKSSSQSSLSHDLQFNISRWKSLSRNDKLSVIDDLSAVISKELGLREQLEVIRIINPKAQILPTDREFVIDINSLDEDKVRRIQEYLSYNAQSRSVPESDNYPPSQKKDCKSHKKQRAQEQRNRQKIAKQRQRKEYRQMMKEKRSGLFAREEVLMVSEVMDPGEEADIDILS